MGVYDHDFEELLEKGYSRPPLEYNRQNKDRNKNILKKLKNPLTAEQYLEKHPEDRDNVRRDYLKQVALEMAKHKEIEELEELTDEEYDNIYYSQEDDTVDETYDGDYNPYKNADFDIDKPEDFDSWSYYAKGAWLKKHTIRKDD